VPIQTRHNFREVCRNHEERTMAAAHRVPSSPSLDRLIDDAEPIQNKYHRN